MSEVKTKSLENLETKMEDLDAGSMRYLVLEKAKSFKASWIGLGQALYTVWKDKLYKEWGYAQFDTYTSKEIGIRKNTALKLLRSYYFLEREEPGYLKNQYSGEKKAGSVPSFEAVDALRLASKKKTIDAEDYADLKRKVLDEGRDARAVKKDLTNLIREREELEPDEARRRRRQALIKRFASTLRSIKKELEISKVLPAQILNDTNKLLSKIEAEIA